MMVITPELFGNTIYNVPNFHEGYCTDEQCESSLHLHRAAWRTQALFLKQPIGWRAAIYAFLWYAFDNNTGRFRNTTETTPGSGWSSHGSEPSHARAHSRAISTALGRSENTQHRNLCALLFQRGTAFRHAQFKLARGVGIPRSSRAFTNIFVPIPATDVVAQMRETLTAMLTELYPQLVSGMAVVQERICKLTTTRSSPTHDPQRILDVAGGAARDRAASRSSNFWMPRPARTDISARSVVNGFWPKSGGGRASISGRSRLTQ